jgi:glutathione S-transferase
MRLLYHFEHSPFSRRTRLALAHKRLDVELREGRERPEWREEAQRLVPLRTLPVLADGARALGDSNAIAHWLDAMYPHTPRLWPEGEDAYGALEVASLVDAALNTAVDVGTRYFALREDTAWHQVTGTMLARAQRAFDGLEERVSALGRPTIAASGWSAADMWLFTAVAWVEGLPGRVETSQNAAQIVTLGLKMPRALSKWADAHRDRADVRALGYPASLPSSVRSQG